MNRTSSITAIAALFVLMLPLAAYAGHGHDDGDQDQPAWHDNGWHKGWYKHHHHHEDDNGPPPSHHWYNGHQACDEDGDDCHVVASEPMTRPHWENQYVCDDDHDSCHWTGAAGQDYWRQHGGYNYGAPYGWYQATPPSSYNLSQRRDWLAARRKRAMYTIKSMRARGDSAAAGRMADAVQGLNHQINALDRQMRGGH